MTSKSNRRHNQSWTPHDVTHMRSLAGKRISARDAASKLGRSHGAVRYKAMVEGVRFCSVEQPKGVQKRIARRTIRQARGA